MCSRSFPFFEGVIAVRSGVLATVDKDDNLRPIFGGLRFCNAPAGVPGRDTFPRAGVLAADPASPDPAASVKRNSTHNREKD